MSQKRILFLHPNFPGQFKHLAKAAAATGHDVRFLCQTHYGRTLPGVQRLTLKGECSHEFLESYGNNILEKTTKLAEQYRRGLENLSASGWQPDIVISHSGWGCGLFVREVWPSCHNIAYLEWWFDPQSDFFKYDTENPHLKVGPQQATKLWLRNQSLALELVSADIIVAPTQWQARQLPTLFRERCHIIHDGIDLKTFRPQRRKQKVMTPKVTYGTRGMEPMRAFPQFIASLPDVMRANPNVIVEIAGQDSINYGGCIPKGHSSWGKWAKQQLAEAGLGERVSWLGYLELGKYVSWLQSSQCHVHLSHPFVASWSLLEALACECPMVVSDVEPVRELCQSTGSTVAYVDHRDPRAISKSILMTLGNPPSAAADMGIQSMMNYSSVQSLEQWSLVAGVQLTTKD